MGTNRLGSAAAPVLAILLMLGTLLVAPIEQGRTLAGMSPANLAAVDLGTLGGRNSTPIGVNRHRPVVGWAEVDPSSEVRHAFLWESEQPTAAPPQTAMPAATPISSASQSAKSFVWDRIDVTVELREDGALHVTELVRVDFTGGPFRAGFREIPLARIEDVANITLGGVDGDLRPYRYVRPSEFSDDVPNTYTYRVTGAALRVEWTFPPTTSAPRTFQIDFDAYGALRVYDEADPPYQQISWIGVDDELTESAPVKDATLTFVLPRSVDPSRTSIQGPGSDRPEDHTGDGRTWTWTASDLGRGDSLEASLRFEPLVEADTPSWQAASDRAEREAGEAQVHPTPTPQVTPVPIATPIATPAALSPCGDAWRRDLKTRALRLLADCTTDRPLLVPDGWTLDGDGHTVFAVDPAGGRLTRGVVMASGSAGTVRDVTIDGSGLTAPCLVDRGLTNVVGVVFAGASGTVSGTTVRHLQRPLPATTPDQPGESERESCGAGIAVLGEGARVFVEDNLIADVGYVGILVEGAQASISRNAIERAADTGILALLGADVRISPGNTISNGAVGIQLEGAGTGGRIAGNTIETMTGFGVAINYGARAAVADNTLTNIRLAGVTVEGQSSQATVEDNRLDEPGEVGIRVFAARAEIRRNAVSGGTYGIAVAGGGASEVVGNTVSRPQDTGIYVLHAGTEATVTSNTVTGATRNGITAVSGAVVAISGENVVRGGERGIALAGSGTMAEVTGNRVEDVSNAGITVVAGAAAPTLSGNTVIDAGFGITVEDAGTSATVTDNTVSEIARTGLTVEDGATADLLRNRVANAGWGIAVAGWGATAEIAENRIERTTTAGMILADGSRTTAASNTLVLPGDIGIRIEDPDTTATVTHHTLREFSDIGIQVGNGAAAEISGNELDGGKRGIVVVSAGTTATIRENSVSTEREGISVGDGARVEPIAANTVTESWTGIVVAGTRTSATVLNNRVSSTSNEGISIRDGATAEVRGNAVRDSRFGDNRGILLAGSGTKATVTENEIANIRGYGIQFSQGAEGTASRNRITTSTRAGIRIIDADTTVTVSGNTVRDAGAIGIEARARQVTITDNQVEGSRQVGIQLGPNSEIEVTGNMVIGPGEQTVDRDGPYGIRVFRGVAGTVSANRIANHRNANPGRTGCGIAVDAGAPDVVVADNQFPAPGNEVDFCDGRVSAAVATPIVSVTPIPVATPIPASGPVPVATPRSAGALGPATTPTGVERVGPVAVALEGWRGATLAWLHFFLAPAAPGRQEVVVQLTNPDGSALTLDAAPTIEVTWTLLTGDGGEVGGDGFATDLRPDAAGTTFTGVVTLAASGWWEAALTITPAGAEAPLSGRSIWLVLPDPNATGTGSRPPTDPAAQALFEQALTALTTLRTVHVETSREDGRGGYSSWITDVRAATAEQPAASVTWRINADGTRTGEMIVSDRRWVTVPGKGWVAADPVPFAAPVEWDALYAGATGFQLGPSLQPDPDEEPHLVISSWQLEEPYQVISFWHPADASPFGASTWYAWAVGLNSRRVYQETIISTRLYQTRVFSRFDEPVEIDPPVVTATPSAASVQATPASTPSSAMASEIGQVGAQGASACAAVWRDDSTAARTLLRDCIADGPSEVPNAWTFDGGGHAVYAPENRVTKGDVRIQSGAQSSPPGEVGDLSGPGASAAVARVAGPGASSKTVSRWRSPKAQDFLHD